LCYQSKQRVKAEILKTILNIIKIKVMKKQTTNQFSSLSKEQTEQLTTVVKETIALGHHNNRIFSAAELWNIQRRSRTIMSRRSFV
jgi:DNA-directed RNA polymerase alpha subunit